MKSGDHGNSHFAEEIAPAHQLRGIFFWLEAEALGATSPSCRTYSAKGIDESASVGAPFSRHYAPISSRVHSLRMMTCEPRWLSLPPLQCCKSLDGQRQKIV
jgi:hypothetical protein